MRHILLTFVILLLLSSTHGKKKDLKRAKELDKLKALPNVCDGDDQRVRLICNCGSQVEINTAKEATCWIYSDTQADEAFSWSHLNSQSNLRALKINLRSGAILSRVPIEILHYVRKLESLEIQYASIRELPAFALGNSSHLIEVALPKNGISHLDLNAISNLQNLESMNLEDNRISELQAMVFHHVPNLRKLFLSKNNLSIVHDNAFRFLNHLHDLELNINSISIVTRETFNGLFRLKRLDLTENRLTMLGDETFAEMPDLEELELESNEIVFLSERAFAGLVKLTRLRLSRNKLVTLSDDLFVNNLRLSFLDLRDNSLDKLKFSLLEPIWDNFKNTTAYLIMDGNMFPCDCHLSWTYTLLQETDSIQIQSGLNELTCIASDQLLDAEVQDTPLTSSEQQDDQFSSKHGDSSYYEEVIYEDLPEEDEGPPRRRIIDIPPGDLPCPEPLAATTAAAPELEEKSVVSWFGGHSSNTSPKVNVFCSFLTLFYLCVLKTAYLT